MFRFLLFLLCLTSFISPSFSQHLKKDGTPDMRYKENKAMYGSSSGSSYTPPSTSSNYLESSSSIHLKKDGTPDMRFKENRGTSNYSPDIQLVERKYSFTIPKPTKTYRSTYTKKRSIHVPVYSYGVTRDSKGKIVRSSSAKYQFMKETGYPHGRKGYVVDHIIPLKKGGCDCPRNMQWQTISEAKEKDKVE